MLFEEKEECCGCTACVNICPKNAIKMYKDENGFFYPKINYSLCVSCGICKKTCSYQSDIQEKDYQNVYAATSKDNEIYNSSSGGIFVSIAKTFLDDNGLVVGSAYCFNDRLKVSHIIIDSKKDLYKLQGSKYVESNIEKVMPLINQKLLEGKKVLFCGTPCQVASIKKYLGEELLSGFFTLDIICHGVPSNELFSSYLEYLEKKHKGKIIEFNFRDKTFGWGLNGSFKLKKNKSIKKYYFTPLSSSYYRFFLNSETYRINCYNCKYANKNRQGDITIGDYWGIEVEHPDILQDNPFFDTKRGISSIIVNTEKGNELIKKYGLNIIMFKSSFNKASKHNKQLIKPSTYSSDRKKIFESYKKFKYFGVEKYYKKKIGVRYYIYRIIPMLPLCIRKIIKR